MPRAVSGSYCGAEAIDVSVDADLLVNALAGVALKLSAALNRGDGARLDVKAMAEAGGRVAFLIEQDLVVVPEAWLTLPASATADADGHQLAAPMALKRLLPRRTAGD